MAPGIPVVLLRNKTDGHDKYEDHLAANIPGSDTIFTPIFLWTLDDTIDAGPAADFLLNTAQLAPTHPLGATSVQAPYGGLIFTSQRALTAFEEALASQKQIDKAVDLSIPIFVVGPTTGAVAERISQAYLPECPVFGQGTGSGVELAAYILDHYKKNTSSSGPRELYQSGDTGSEHVPNTDQNSEVRATEMSPGKWRHPLLWFTGEQRRDILPRTLMSSDLDASERIQVDERCVYRTVLSPQLEEELTRTLEREVKSPISSIPEPAGAELADQGHEQAESERRVHECEQQNRRKRAWVVLFSPASCATVLRVLGWNAQNRDWVSDDSRDKAEKKRYGKMVGIVTIGPTTRDYLLAEFGFTADVCAARPTPEAVREGIEAFHKNK